MRTTDRRAPEMIIDWEDTVGGGLRYFARSTNRLQNARFLVEIVNLQSLMFLLKLKSIECVSGVGT